MCLPFTKRILSIALPVFLLGCSSIRTTNSLWRDVDLSMTAFDGHSTYRVGDGNPNLIAGVDVTAMRGKWLKLSGRVNDSSADIGFRITLKMGSRFVGASLPALCESLEGPTSCTAYSWIPPDATTATVAVWPQAFSADVSDLRVQMSGQLIEAPQSRVRLANILATIRENYYLSDEVDWDAVERTASQPLRAPEGIDPLPAAVAVVRQMLPGNKHTLLVRSQERVPDRVSLPDMPSCRPIDGNTWLLELPSIGRQPSSVYDRYIAAARTCFTEAQQQTRWIVDLRENRGGAMPPMLAALAPLIRYGPLLSFVNSTGTQIPVSLRSDGIAIGPNLVLPHQNPAGTHANVPVVAWIGERCGSSCEAVVIALEERPDTVLVGEPTAGLTTGNEIFPVSQDYDLVLSTGWMAHTDGRRAPDKIVPHIQSSDEDATALLGYFPRR